MTQDLLNSAANSALAGPAYYRSGDRRRRDVLFFFKTIVTNKANSQIRVAVIQVVHVLMNKLLREGVILFSVPQNLGQYFFYTQWVLKRCLLIKDRMSMNLAQCWSVSIQIWLSSFDDAQSADMTCLESQFWQSLSSNPHPQLPVQWFFSFFFFFRTSSHL